MSNGWCVCLLLAIGLVVVAMRVCPKGQFETKAVLLCGHSTASAALFVHGHNILSVFEIESLFFCRLVKRLLEHRHQYRRYIGQRIVIPELPESLN